jgi:tetratricopeptide (TPR) repeat protein
MKKYIVLFPLVLSSMILSGQKPVDFLMKGRALLEADKADDAVNTLTEALGQYNRSDLFLQRAEAFLKKGDYSNAAADFNSANSLEPASGEYGLARIYGLKNDPSTAVYHLEANLKSRFKKSEKEIMLDPAFGAIENTSEWRQFLKKDWYGNYEKGFAEIEYDISTGQIEDAKSTLSGLIRDYPGNDGNIYAGALISFAEKKYPETVKAMTGIIPGNPDDEKYLRLLAQAQEAGGNPAGASLTYTRLLDLGIPDAGLLLKRAECYRRTGETSRAMDDIGKYLEFYPQSKKALSFAGKVESAGGDNIKALQYFSENLKLHPHDADCYIDRANSYFVSKSWNWAIKDYSMSLDLQPDNPDVWLNKGISLLNSGNLSDACHDFRKAFSLGNKKATELISRNCIK